MSKLAEFRAKYPQYNDVSDEALAESLHKKFYSSIPFDDFSSQIGLRKSGILPALQGGIERFISSGQTAIESVTGSPEEASIAGAERQQEIGTRFAPGADLEKVKEVYKEDGLPSAIGEAVSQIPEAVAEMSPFIATTLAGAKLGAMAGTAIAPGPGTVIGGIGGAFLPSLVTRYGTNVEQQAVAQQAEKKPVDINRLKALGYAVPQAAIDTAANAFPILGRTALAKVLGPTAEKALAKTTAENAEKIASQSLARRMASGIGENLAVQGVAQPLQVMITRLQAGQPLLNEEAINAYGHAVYMAALVSPIGAYGGVKERTTARGMIEQKNTALDQAFAKLVEADTAARAGTDAPTRPQSALVVQKALGVPLSQAKVIREQLIERGDITRVPDRKYGQFLNPDKLKTLGEPDKTAEPEAKPGVQTLSTEQLLGDIVERPPEELAAEQAATQAAARPQQAETATPLPAQQAETVSPGAIATTPEVPLPVVRKGKQQKPPAERITSPENPVFQTGASLVKQLHEAGTPITPENFRSALTPLIGKELPPLQVGNLLGALTRNNVLSKPDENKARAYIVPTEVSEFTGAKPREGVANEPVSAKPANVDLESVGRGVEPLVSGNRAGVVEPEGGVPGRVGGAGKPAVVGNAPERGVKPALREAAKPEEAVAERVEVPVAERVEVPVAERVEVPAAVKSVEPPVVEPPAAPRPQTIPEGEPVPRSAQPSAPDVFAPSPEQARISTETIDSGLVPGRGIRRAEARMEEARQAQREREVPPPPEEGVSQKYDSVAESLRAGNLGEALYRLRNETEGKSPLYWLADKLFNVTEVKDDRSQLINGETQRIAREQGIDKQKEPEEYAKLAESVKRTIMSDIDLSRYRFVNLKGEVDAKGKPTKLAELAKNFKPKFERMVPVGRGLASYNRATGKFEFLREAEPKKPDNRYLPYVVEPATTESPFKKTAFGGAKVFVEGGENVKGQNKAVIDRLQREGKLAEYNPKTNTFYFTEAGLTDRVILHEMVHSATVGVMKKFLSREVKDLAPAQLEGAKEIVRIYKFSKKALGNKFKNAYENEYEFITYAMTNEGFQRALSNFRARKPSVQTKLRSAWDSFTVAVAKMVGLDKFAQQAKPLSAKVRTAGELDNALLRVIDSVGDILTVPKAGVEVEPLAARRPQRVQLPRRLRAPVAPQHPTGNTRDVFIDSRAPSTLARAWNVLKKTTPLTHEGYENFAFLVQNHRRGFLKQEETLNRAKLIRRINNPNNTNELMTLAMSKQDVIDKRQITPLVNTLSSALTKYAQKVGITMPEAAERLGVFRMALNEVEKRAMKFLEYVPLDDAPILNISGTPMSPAAYRDALLSRAATGRLSSAENTRIRQQLETLASRYAKIGGKSRQDRVPATAADALDIDAPHYQVVGYHPTDLRSWRRAYQREQRANQAEMQEVFDALNAINEERINLDRQGNYWTPQVDNFREIYNYQHYVPFKGLDKSGTDIGFDLDTTARSGTQFRQAADKAEGRRTGIENPLYQSIQDLQQASGRAAREGITESIKNQIKDGDLEGKLVERVTFADRHSGLKTREDLTGKKVFFHHMPNGDIEVYSLKDPRLVDGLNGFYGDVGMITRVLAVPTHFMGRMHTFYNPAFAPYNFVRDALTNSYTMGARFGPTATVKTVAAITRTMVTSRGMTQAAKISRLYQKGDMAGIAAMRGGFAKDAYEYLVEQGGRGAFQQAYDLGTIERKVLDTPGKWVKAKDAVDGIATTWADTFEFVSRVGAYSTVKKELIAEAKARGINTNSPDFIAGLKQEASAFTKNMFNYEQTGKYGRELGAWYMFLRPSLTSAVRAVDLVKPAFESADAAIARGPESLKITDPNDPNFARSEAARAEFRKQHAKEKKNARIMTLLLGGLGYLAYNMSMSASDTDIQGRNKVATDDMSMWTRAWRYPTMFSGDGNEFLQIPWGFGLGAFAALGAQFAAWNAGNQSGADMLTNTVPISLDSFIPLPSPRYSPLEYPAEFLLDSVAPTPLKPVIQLTINLDNFGRELYNDRVSKYGEAFSGKSYVSKWARDFTEWAASTTIGRESPVQLNPAIVEYLVNNYADALGKFTNAIYGVANMSERDRPFDAKKDIPLLSSFVGKASNVDAREFSDLRSKMEEKSGLLKSLEERPELFERYVLTHPEDMTMVELYNKTINSDLKELQEDANKLNSGVGEYSDISEGVKLQLIKDNREMQNIIKYNFVQSIKALEQQQKQK